MTHNNDVGYPWICTYFGADVGEGVKANQAYDGRGMMTEHPTAPDFLVRFFLNITRDEVGTGGVGSWYVLLFLLLSFSPFLFHYIYIYILHGVSILLLLFLLYKTNNPTSRKTLVRCFSSWICIPLFKLY